MPYHHGNLRASLIDAATEVAATRGPDAVSLREVARQVGVSHNAAYRHFADRDELMRAVAGRAMTLFGRLMQQRIADVGKRRGKAAAYDRLGACGRSYVEFATEHNGLFRAAIGFPMGSVPPDDDEVEHPYAQLSQRLDELVATKAVTRARRANAEIAAVSAVHGFAMLVIDGPWRAVPEAERNRDLDEVLRVVRFGI